MLKPVVSDSQVRPAATAETCDDDGLPTQIDADGLAPPAPKRRRAA
eukprot:gene11748-8480_t